MRGRFTLAAAFAAAYLSLLPASHARALDYPTHPVKIVVSYPPGGSTDISARLIAQYLGEKLGQQFIVENRPGGGNNIGTDFALKAKPDGYTLFLANPANTINATLYKHLTFDFLKDSTPVAGIMRIPNVMEVNPNVPAKTVAEFISYAKANPGKINMASSGNGTSIHLSGMLFMGMTGIKMQHVPYKGSAPALIDLLAGQVQVMFDNLPSSIGHIHAGKLRALAVTTATRAPELPDVPTVAETVPGYEASAFFGIVAPKGTPKEIVDLLNKTIDDGLKDPRIVGAIKKLGGSPMVETPDSFGKFLADETAKWRKVVLDANLSIE
ncbi:MAG TPA: tripartite tricarboxylate transporter substrate binding protein [Pseudolabrys sp.]|nr:tripartite tricarboxylate transporter substrate binding protein [Pseudolabrys sp.]